MRSTEKVLDQNSALQAACDTSIARVTGGCVPSRRKKAHARQRLLRCLYGHLSLFYRRRLKIGAYCHLACPIFHAYLTRPPESE